ncbi:MAG: hypothetical protein ABL885_06000 [Methylophilaceae bacterium]
MLIYILVTVTIYFHERRFSQRRVISSQTVLTKVPFFSLIRLGKSETKPLRLISLCLSSNSSAIAMLLDLLCLCPGVIALPELEIVFLPFFVTVTNIDDIELHYSDIKIIVNLKNILQSRQIGWSKFKWSIRIGV